MNLARARSPSLGASPVGQSRSLSRPAWLLARRCALCQSAGLSACGRANYHSRMQNCLVDWTLALEYFKVAASWPPVSVVLVLLLGKRLQAPIVSMFGRIRTWKAVGIEATLSDPAGQQLDAAKKPAAEDADLLTQNSSDPVRARSEILRLWGLYNYERFFNVVFGTQLQLLEHLRLLGNVGCAPDDLDKFFAAHKASGGDSTAESYFKFLADTGLMDVKNNVSGGPWVKISETGLAFLDHIRRTYGASSANRMF